MYWYCILVAALIPYLCNFIAKSSMSLKENSQPRAYLAKLEGFRARANWAQENCFEIFPVFSAAVIAAHITAVEPETITNFALAFIVLRIAYVTVYIADQPTMRSLIWFAGLGCCVYLLVSAGMQ